MVKKSVFRGPIFLPVETIARDLDAKFLLAAMAISRDYVVIIGKKSKLRDLAVEIGGGVYLHKAHNDHHVSSYFNPLKENNVKIIALDEEGFVWPSGPAYLKSRVKSRAPIDCLDQLLVWGGVQKKWLYEGFPDKQFKNLHVVGNPRFDLLRKPFSNVYEKPASRLRRKHGRFLLVNTKFAAANPLHTRKQSYIDRLRAGGRIRSLSDEVFWKGHEQYIKLLYLAYVQGVKELAHAFPNINFIVRPHPSEEKSTWVSSLASVSNAYVENSGSVIPWILASEGVIHTNCTTGVEAFVLGKPVLRYHPSYDSDYESNFSNAFGIGFDDIDCLINYIGKTFDKECWSNSNETKNKDEAKLIKEHVENFSGAFSCERILDSINTFEATELPFSIVSRLSYKTFLAGKARYNFVNLLRKLNSFTGDVPDLSSGFNFLKKSQKFPGIKLESVNDMIKKFAKLSDSDKTIEFNVEAIDYDCFMISPIRARPSENN